MKRVAWITVGWTYVLMVWGNIVSSTGSGLACPDWPLCHGTITPPARADIILEWGHRLLAASAGVLILLTAFMAVRRASAYPELRKLLGWIVGLLAAQILLGGLTVALGLSVAASTIHLMTASIVFAGLIAIAVTVSNWAPSPHLAARRLWVLAFGILLQFALGGLVRHSHAGLACPNFPNCLESFWPDPFTTSVALVWLHRWVGVALAVFSIFLWQLSRPLVVLVWMQVGLGIVTVLTSLHVHTRATHAALGYMIFGLCVYQLVRRGAIKWLTPLRSS